MQKSMRNEQKQIFVIALCKAHPTSATSFFLSNKVLAYFNFNKSSNGSQFLILSLVLIVLSLLSDNWALLWAQRLALKQEVPLYVTFCLPPTYLDATLRQYKFMIDGLKSVEKVSVI